VDEPAPPSEGASARAKRRPEIDAYDFNTALREATTPAACARLFLAAVAPFGFDTFASGEIDPANRERCVFYIIEWSDRWRRFYLQSGLVENDPIVDTALGRTAPFTWDDLRRENKVAQLGTAALELAAAEGYVEGLIVPLPRLGGRVGLVSLAGRKIIHSQPVRAYLTLISICLDNHVRSLVAREGFAVPPMGLTDRELECLRLVARGQADKEIAQTMGVQPSTAHEFVEKAKRRLRAGSRAEMIAVAVSLGMIDI
jgi:DNA-binding CsgD family transcriptional regulator